VSERPHPFGKTERDDGVVLGDQNFHLGSVGKTASARVPPPGRELSSKRPRRPCSTTRWTSWRPSPVASFAPLPQSSTR